MADKLSKFFYDKRAEDEHSLAKHIIYWVLIIACIVIMWFIVNGIIHKLLVLY